MQLQLPFEDSIEALNVTTYAKDGFYKVCRVSQCEYTANWHYYEINEDIMFCDHKSWVYFIVDDTEIVKVGETGNPLGIRNKVDKNTTGSTSRLGRYMNGDQSDQFVRDSLADSVDKGTVAIYAKKCDYIETPVVLGGVKTYAKSTIHKDLEMQYLDHIYFHTGQYPRLNKGRK